MSSFITITPIFYNVLFFLNLISYPFNFYFLIFSFSCFLFKLVFQPSITQAISVLFKFYNRIT